MTVTDPVDQQMIAYNARDVESFLPYFSEDCLFMDDEGKEIMRGHEAMASRFGQMFAASPELNSRVASRIVVGPYVIDDERVTGRAGIEGEGRVVAVHKVVDGKIASVQFFK